MNSKKFCECACCGDRLTASCRCSRKGKCIRLFVAAPLPEFCDVLTTINNNHQVANAVTDVARGENEDNGTDQLIDDTSSVGDSMDDGSIRVQTANTSSSDSESMYDSTVTSDQVDDEEINSDESSEAVTAAGYILSLFSLTFLMDTIPSDENTDEQGIEVPIEVSVFSKSQCCVCKKQIVPSTVTIREADRTELFIRRHIDIPAGSRCCKLHTVDKRLITWSVPVSDTTQSAISTFFSTNAYKPP
ncbi:unnamed protein product [Rotaria magnacalcarata]|uniref:Uncharacterized protein n=3 Tax=Rotaria magnacalcarata TaxID=392030 RepID=A0A8S2M3A6_9BILA|nr:unnamed protein product [Rotaria magnacalcarata]